jgi:hypothetical protein
MTGQTKQAAGTVVLETAAEYPQSAGIQGGSDGFPRVSVNPFAVELKRDCLPAINFQMGMLQYSKISYHLIDAPF